ncbi:MAG TPA: CRTAC1 family protein [Acidobacteriota bacterium]|nr:CRTAC1 family protein [Acidobacteriota bacterium]
MAVVAMLSAGLVQAQEARAEFVDVTRQAGIEWTHRNGATEEKFLIETMGGGAAWLDFDGDGWLDLYLVDSGDHARSSGSTPGRHALYRNNGDGTFSDVAAKAGVQGGFYGNGAAVGDYDNDGDPDLYVTAWGANRLYRNNADGTFSDVTSKAAVEGQGWSTSAAFFDIDNDGDLDLFVCQYLDWDYDKEVYCGEKSQGRRSYCHPDQFGPVPSLLYRNNGDGTFSEVAEEAGVGVPGKALGVVTGDIDGDGDQDLYVANDAVANYLFRNRGDGTFVEEGLMAEVAYGMAVKPESGMGTDLGDVDGDGRLDLIVTNIDYEMNNLYVNRDADFFTDVTITQGHGQGDLLYSGFGVRFFDKDNDGDLDLAVLNGHPLDNIHLFRDRVTGAQMPFLLENRKGKLINVGEKQGGVWTRLLDGRALASADYDNDGDIDLVFVNVGAAPILLENQLIDGTAADAEKPEPSRASSRQPAAATGVASQTQSKQSDKRPTDAAGVENSAKSFLGVMLEGSKSNRDGVGARLTLKTDRRILFRERTGGGSYQAAHDPRIHFGLQAGEELESLTIRWPSGLTQSLQKLRQGRYQRIQEPSIE